MAAVRWISLGVRDRVRAEFRISGSGSNLARRDNDISPGTADDSRCFLHHPVFAGMGNLANTNTNKPRVSPCRITLPQLNMSIYH
jgi:hypothetical protein